MPKVISNTSCLILLDNIDSLFILEELYKKIYITKEVAQEFSKPLKGWMTVLMVEDKNYLRILNTSVDLGEASTIALSIQMAEENFMILDDLKARKLARQLELRFTGLLGILLKAKKQNIIPTVADILTCLKKSNFRVSENLEKEVLMLANEL